MMTQIRNHRPDLRPELADYAIWLDGSGRPLPDLLDAGGENGCDCRGRYDLVALNHYALRSIDSLLVKRRRGDVVVAEKVPVSQRYFRQRNLGGSREVALAARAGMIEAALEVLLADRALAALHAECVRRHQEIIAELHRDPGAMEARAWMEAIAAEQEAKAAAAAGEDTETDAEG
jgi:hypothetical protein